ncbi:MAG: N-acetylmuramoyl-L-alanine amidase [Prolixibacteraceae bacterium]
MLRNIYLPFFILVFCMYSSSFAQNSDLILNTVVIDPGHGGKDPGTSMGKLLEKDIVLDVALKVGEYIKKEFPNVKVIYTREKDVFIPLDERANIANKHKADLFISLHVNYYTSESTYGSETYILGNHRSEDNLKVAQLENSVILLEDDYSTRYEGFDPNSAESYIMFELIQNEFLEQSRYFADQVQNSFIAQAKRRSRGVKQAGFLVLRKTVMPSILIELGYISNPNEKKYIENDLNRTELANAIGKAFSSYKQRTDERSGITVHVNHQQEQTVITPEIMEPTMDDRIKTENWYATQIIASNKIVSSEELNLGPNQYYFQLFEKGLYKYYTGFTQNYTEALKNKNQLQSKFKGSFPVVFIGGKKETFKKMAF